MIYETLEDVLPIVQEMKVNYAKEGVELLGIFGSFARAEEDIYSDIDIAYNLNFSLFDKFYHDGFSKLLRLQAIREEMEEKLHKKVDLLSLKNTNDMIKARILKEIVYV